MSAGVMRYFYQYSITALWIAWLLYWSAAAIGAKATRRKESLGSQLSHIVPLSLGIALLSSRELAGDLLDKRFLPSSIAWFWLGFVGVVLGLAVAILAI